MNRWLIGLESFVAVTATAGGILLAVRPDGSLLDADVSALATSPFTDWRVPGLLLLALVGGGFTLAALVEWRELSWAPALSIIAGAGLVLFEAAELIWIGPQPLQALMAVIGIAVIALAAPDRSHRPSTPDGRLTRAGHSGPLSGRNIP